MAQSNLLELAKGGDPEAIASLIKLVLEPKGVSVKTKLQDHCLHIFFTSEQLLSQPTITDFVRSGLNTLKANSIERVKIYAQKLGQNAPVWTEEFSMLNKANLPTPQPTSTAFPTPASPTPASTPSTQPARQSALLRSTAPSKQPKRAAQSIAKRHPNSPPRAKSIGGFNQLRKRLKPYNWRPIAAITGVGAFLIGGAIAATSHSQSKSTVQPTSVSSPPKSNLFASNQMLVPPRSQAPATPVEAQAEQYLTRMNRAQQSYYEANGRFAATLEELERSALIISQNSQYAYHLTIRDQAQSVLTATPKAAGFRSYTGSVLAQTSERGATTEIVCRTGEPSSFPPVFPQAMPEPVQCPADSIQVKG